MVQGSNDPIVIREGEELPNLVCEGCDDSVLIENYLKECFVGIGLQCFKCSHTTWTPTLPDGEVFPKTTISMGKDGKYLIGSSIVNSQDVVITCDQEIEVAKSQTSPLNSANTKFELSVESLDALAVELDVFSGGRFNQYLLSAQRSIAHKSKYFRENPLAWSIELLKKQLINNELNMNNSTLVALGFLQAYKDISARWRHHVHFPILATEICAFFYHSLIQLIAASYLEDHGNNIAINVAGKEDGRRSADLYFRLSGSEKLFIEVKVPEALEWTCTEIPPGKMKKSVEKCLSKSRGQIEDNNPGILVIGTTCLDGDFLDEFGRVVEKVLKAKGKDYPAVACVSVIGLKEISANGHGYPGSRVSTSFSVSMFINKKYFKENPIASSTLQSAAI